MAIKIDLLAAAVTEELREYADIMADDVKKAASKAADDAVKELRQTSPAHTGRYRKGWTKKKAYESATEARYTVYNATDANLTHLLEKGHAKRGGGRVAATPHIAAAEEKAIEEMTKLAREAAGK